MMTGASAPFQNSPSGEQILPSSSDPFVSNLAKWIQILSALVSLVALFSLGGYYISLRNQPYWQVEPIPPHLVAQRVSEYQAARQAYVQTVDLLNQRLRFDLVAAPLLAPSSQGIQFDSIHYQTVYGEKGLEGSIMIQGLATRNDVDALKQHLQAVRQNMARLLPERRVTVMLKETRLEKRTGYLLFSSMITLQ